MDSTPFPLTPNMGAGVRLAIEPVLAMILAYHTESGPGHAALEGGLLRFDKDVLRTFALTGSCCTECKLRASHFEIMQVTAQAGPPGQPPQLFLQLVTYQKNNRIVFTQDHRLARSLGGADDRDNLATMCKNCNLIKSRKEHALLLTLREAAGLTQDGKDPMTQTMPSLMDALGKVGKRAMWDEVQNGDLLTATAIQLETCGHAESAEARTPRRPRY